MNLTYDDIREEFSDSEETVEFLNLFIEAKEKYLQTESIEDSIDMKMKYVNIYEQIKCGWYDHRYSEEKFLAFKECLQRI